MFQFLNKSRDQLLRECEVQTDRGSGPGGARADTTESSVRILHSPSGLKAKSSEHRSQNSNKKTAVRRLKNKFAREIRHDIDTGRIRLPDQLQKYRNGGFKINIKNLHYPFLVKLVLDVFVAEKGRLGPSADVLGISTNQLVTFFAEDDKLWTKANTIRQRFDHASLKK